MHRSIVLVVVLFLQVPASIAPVSGQLGPTAHPSVPARVGDLWLVPSASERSSRATSVYEPLRNGVKLYREEKYAAALGPLTRPAPAGTALAEYAAYYAALARLRQSQFAEARRTLDRLVEQKPAGHLGIAVLLAAGETAEAEGNYRAAIAMYERIAADQTAVTGDVLSRLGRAALGADDRKKAAEAFLRVYYEFPLTDEATSAASHLAGLSDHLVRTSYKLDIGRAQQLFGARRYAEARSAFQDLQRHVGGDDRELADLRVAECDFYLKRYAAARDATRPYLDRASRKAEARFFHLSAIRELGDHDRYVALTRAFVQEFPDSSWAEEALNSLGTHYILTNDDERAAQVFRELYAKFPSGQRAERAAWKHGWWAYRTADYAETVRVFESAATTFSRSDYRPSFLYWAARSHARLGDSRQANARLRLVFSDYANSYYGRLAEKRLERLAAASEAAGIVRATFPQPPAAAPRPGNEAVIRLLLANGLYDDAINELRYAQRVWGPSPLIDATIAWAYHKKGELRQAITIMRRAYPQFLTAGGQKLPTEVLQVIFPLSYWDVIRKHSIQRGLDPYLVAALIAQESTFDPAARSVANAWGMMQILPSTGRRLARTLGIRNFRTAMLTNPQTNIRLGTLHFSRLVKQFGGTHYALASYNAGESRVVRWKAERPGLDQDEFIDDIPFPETQNYVKRILGTAEDYRWLYGEAGGKPQPAAE
jgi:soluble lytic murein transglycosylase